MTEPTFTLKATDPAAATALRAYIDCAKRQGATQRTITTLNDLLLEFAIFTRKPAAVPTQPIVAPSKKARKS